jgi:hypothetical protein
MINRMRLFSRSLCQLSKLAPFVSTSGTLSRYAKERRQPLGFYQMPHRGIAFPVEQDFHDNKCNAKNEIRDVYKNLLSKVINKISRIKADDKKLLIVIGEDHFDRRALAIQFLFIQHLFKIHNINLMIQPDQCFIDKVRNGLVMPIHVNAHSLIKFADENKINLTSLSPRKGLSIDIFISEMKKSLMQADKDAAIIIGSKFLTYIDEDKDLNAKYDTLIIDSDNRKSDHELFNLINLAESDSLMPEELKLNPKHSHAILSKEISALSITEIIDICKGIANENHLELSAPTPSYKR